MSERLDFLKKITRELTGLDFTIPNLNSGGCGVFAAELGKHLLHYGYSITVVSLGHKKRSLEVIRMRIAPMSNYNLIDLHYTLGLGLYHFLIKWTDEQGQDWYIDSEGVHTEEEVSKQWCAYIEAEFTLDEMTMLADQKPGWSPRFNRQFIPKLAEKIREKIYSAWYLKRPSFADFTLASAR